MRAIERVDAGAVATQRRDHGAVGVEHHRGFVVALPGAGRDGLARRLDCERRWNAMGRQRIAPRPVDAPINVPAAAITILKTCFMMLSAAPRPIAHSLRDDGPGSSTITPPADLRRQRYLSGESAAIGVGDAQSFSARRPLRPAPAAASSGCRARRGRGTARLTSETRRHSS